MRQLPTFCGNGGRNERPIAPQFDYAPDRGLLVRKFDKSAILTVASWPKDGGSALALGAVGTSRACATEKSFFFFSYYYYYWGVPPEACPSSLKVEKTMASFSLRDTDNHFKGNLCISDLPFVTKSVAKMCDVPCIQWLS